MRVTRVRARNCLTKYTIYTGETVSCVLLLSHLSTRSESTEATAERNANDEASTSNDEEDEKRPGSHPPSDDGHLSSFLVVKPSGDCESIRRNIE